MTSKFSKEAREQLESMPDELKSMVTEAMLDEMSPEQIEMASVMINVCEEKGIDMGSVIDGTMDSLESFEGLFGIEFPHTTRSMALDPEGIPTPTLILTADDVDTIALFFAEREKVMLATVKEMAEVVTNALNMANDGLSYSAVGYLGREIAKIRDRMAEQTAKDNG